MLPKFFLQKEPSLRWDQDDPGSDPGTEMTDNKIHTSRSYSAEWYHLFSLP